MTISVIELMKLNKKSMKSKIKLTQLYFLQNHYYLEISVKNKTRYISYHALIQCRKNIKRLHENKVGMKYRYAIKTVNNWLEAFEKIEEYRKAEKKELKKKLEKNLSRKQFEKFMKIGKEIYSA